MKKILGLTLVAILGCNGDKNTTETEGGSSGGSTGGSTGDMSGTTTTGPTTGNATDNSGSGGETEMGSSGAVTVTDGTGGGLTTGGTTGDGTTGDGTTGGTTGGGNIDIMADCQAVCDLAGTCMLDPGPDCLAGCLGEFEGAMGECQAAIDGYLMCLANMSCMELVDLFMNDNPGPCIDAILATEMACNMGGDCTSGVGGNPQGTECSLTTECPNEPVREMQCVKDQCACLVDGMEVATCPSDMVCKTLDQLEAKAADCCGF